MVYGALRWDFYADATRPSESTSAVKDGQQGHTHRLPVCERARRGNGHAARGPVAGACSAGTEAAVSRAGQRLFQKRLSFFLSLEEGGDDDGGLDDVLEGEQQVHGGAALQRARHRVLQEARVDGLEAQAHSKS